MTRTYFIKSDNTLHLYLYKSSTATDSRLSYFKRKVLEALKASEERERREVRKSLLVMEKANYPVGTIRTWKGGKVFIKVAPGRWRPKYDAHTRGAKQSIRILQKKVAACTDAMQLMKLVEEHKQRFCDKNGNLYDWVHDLHDFAREQRYKILTAVNKDVEKRHAEVKARREAEERKAKETAAMNSAITLASEVLKSGNAQTITNPDREEIEVRKGTTDTAGGLMHIISRRLSERIRKRTASEIDNAEKEKILKDTTAVVCLVCNAIATKKLQIEPNGNWASVKDGIKAVVTRERKRNKEKYLLTGYDLRNEKETATDAMNAVIAQHSNTPAFLCIYEQAGAVYASMTSIPQGGKKSSKKDPLEGKSEEWKRGYKYAIERAQEHIKTRESFNYLLGKARKNLTEQNASIPYYSQRNDTEGVDKCKRIAQYYSGQVRAYKDLIEKLPKEKDKTIPDFTIPSVNVSKADIKKEYLPVYNDEYNDIMYYYADRSPWFLVRRIKANTSSLEYYQTTGETKKVATILGTLDAEKDLLKNDWGVWNAKKSCCQTYQKARRCLGKMQMKER